MTHTTLPDPGGRVTADTEDPCAWCGRRLDEHEDMHPYRLLGGQVVGNATCAEALHATQIVTILCAAKPCGCLVSDDCGCIQTINNTEPIMAGAGS